MPWCAHSPQCPISVASVLYIQLAEGMGLRSEDSLRAEGYLGVCRLRADQADLVNLLCLKIRNDAGKIKDADLLAPRDGHACKTPRWPVRGGPIVGAESATATATAAARRLYPGESKPNFRSNQPSRGISLTADSDAITFTLTKEKKAHGEGPRGRGLKGSRLFSDRLRRKGDDN